MTDIEAVQEQLAQLTEQVEALQEENERLREENERLRERVDDLEDEVRDSARIEWESTDHSDMSVVSAEGTRYPLGAAVEKRPTEYDVEDLVEDLVDGDLGDHADEHAEPSVERETPLEDVVALPEDVAERSLTQNQRRARFVAMDPRDYGDSCMAGRVLTAGRIGKILRAGLDVDPHPETVRRVMEILDDLGEESTTLRKRNAEKRIIFDEDLVERLEKLSRIEAHTEMSQVTG